MRGVEMPSCSSALPVASCILAVSSHRFGPFQSLILHLLQVWVFYTTEGLSQNEIIKIALHHVIVQSMHGGILSFVVCLGCSCGKDVHMYML